MLERCPSGILKRNLEREDSWRRRTHFGSPERELGEVMRRWLAEAN
jgi:hypothetical protein